MRIKQPEIIYEDEAIIVCRKEAGVAVQTARAGQADMVSLLKNYRAKKKEEPYIGLIHRLDQPVEGVMVFAKTPQAAAKLSAQVSSRSMEKEYLAVTDRYAGTVKKESFATGCCGMEKYNTLCSCYSREHRRRKRLC